MNRKSIVFATTLITASTAVALPSLSNAATQRDGLQACVNALTNELAKQRNNEVNVLLGNAMDVSGQRLGATEVFHLDARSSDDNQVISRVDCVVNSRADVRSLRVLPLNAEQASVRAAN